MAIWCGRLWVLLVPLTIASAGRLRYGRQRHRDPSSYIYYIDGLNGNASCVDDSVGFSRYSCLDYSQDDPSMSLSSGVIEVILTSEGTGSISTTEDNPVLSSQDEASPTAMTTSLLGDGDMSIPDNGITSSFPDPRRQASSTSNRRVVADLQEARERRVFGSHFGIINRIRGRANDPGSYVDPRRQRELRLFTGLTHGRKGVDSGRLAEADGRSRLREITRRARDPSSSSSSSAPVRRTRRRRRRRLDPSVSSASSSADPVQPLVALEGSSSDSDPVLLYGNVLMRLTRRGRHS